MPLNPSRRSGEPRSAALVPATDVRAKMRTASSSGERWQRQVIKYDREGPGILGYYLDTVGLLASLCPLVVEVRQKDGSWTRSDDPVLAVALAGYQSKLVSQPDLVALHARHREALGECWVIYSDELGWIVQTVPNVNVTSGGDVVDFTDLYGMKRRVPKDRVWKSWVPDPYEPWLPTSPVRRALPELRRLNASTRNQTRSAESRLVTNGMVAFRPDASGARPLRNVEGGGPQRDGAEKIVDDFITLAQEAFHDDDAPSAGVPFPYVGEPAVPIELGRGIDQHAMAVEEKAIEAFARAVNFPAQLLTMGPGSANHWNEWLLQESQHKMGLAPKLLPVCNDITEFYLRPMVAKIRNRVGSWDIRPDNVRVGFDMTFLTKKPDLAGQVMEAYRMGLIAREEVCDTLGITKPLDVPVGLSEYEHWELATGSKGAPYAEVDADGRLILPPTDGGMGMGMDMGVPGPGEGMGNPEDMGAEPMDAEQAAPEEAPFAVEDAVMGADNRQMPMPPPEVASARTAALSDETAALMAIPGKMADVDKKLEAELIGLSTAMQTAIRSEVAKEAVKRLPPRSPERARLRSLSPEELWKELPDDVKNDVDVDAIAQREVEKYREQVEALFAAAQAEAQDAWTFAGLTFPQLLLAAGVAVFLVGVADEVKDAFDALAKSPLDAMMLAGRKMLRPVRSRTVVARAAMSAAAGARVDADGRIVRSQSGTPATLDGSDWSGSTGFGLGDIPAKAFEDEGDGVPDPVLPPGVVTPTPTPGGGPTPTPGVTPAPTPVPTPGVTRPKFRMRYRWEHSFFGKPDEPYKPHLALDGQYFSSLADVPGGLYPGDHAWCRCAFLWDPEILD